MSSSMGDAVGRAMRELGDREAAAAQVGDRKAEQLRHAIDVIEMAEVFVAWALSHGVRPDICDDNRQHLLALRRQREEHNARLSRRERRQGKEVPLDEPADVVVTTRLWCIESKNELSYSNVSNNGSRSTERRASWVVVGTTTDRSTQSEILVMGEVRVEERRDGWVTRGGDGLYTLASAAPHRFELVGGGVSVQPGEAPSMMRTVNRDTFARRYAELHTTTGVPLPFTS